MNSPLPCKAGFPGSSARRILRNRLSPWVARFVAVTLVLLMQGPAMLLQEVAWMRMLATYTQERGLKRGVVETFDGNHPCELCLKASEIRENKSKDQPAEQQNGAMRFRFAWAEMIPAAILILPVISGRELVMLEVPFAGDSRGRAADAPGSPPPEHV